MGSSLFEKLWSTHVVRQLGDGYALIYVDRHILNDIVYVGLSEVERRGFKVVRPSRTLAVPDHTMPTLNQSTAALPIQVIGLREQARKHGIQVFDPGQSGFGIIHQMAPEEGLVWPGCSFTCGDSHSSTIGALGALAWGIGVGEVTHILATQTSVQLKPGSMRIWLEGQLTPGITGKDVIMHVIRTFGAESGVGYAVEYAGPVVQSLGMSDRFTICNMAVEMGARFGMIAPDDTTFAYLEGTARARFSDHWDRAIADWRGFVSDADATFDKELRLDLTNLRPQVSWGTTLDHIVSVDESIPVPDAEADPRKRQAMQAALRYMDLEPGSALKGTAIDWAFIGSCTNGRLDDLRAAAAIVKGHHVASGVRAWVVPGSERTKRLAEAEHLDDIFKSAGFEWRQPACSMCAGGTDWVPAGQRAISSTNRNFEGRQGPGARTHLASPAMVAAAAIAGCITDIGVAA